MNDGAFVLLFFFFFFAAWLASGGPSKPISFAGPYITPITTTGVTQTGYGKPINLNTSIGIGSARATIGNIQSSVSNLNQQVQDAKLFGTPSPYKGQVTISWGNSLGGTDPKQEYIAIRAAHDAPQNVTITGWKLVAISNDNGATIPQGQEIFFPNSTATAPIVLHPDDVAYINTGESPIGESFRENECMGYYTNGEPIEPSLSQSCPAPIDDFNAHYNGNRYSDPGCYDTIQNLYSCARPNDGRGLSDTCYAFIDKYLTYPGCVASHAGDQYFSGTTWRIYLGRTAIIGHQNDIRYYGTLWKSGHDAIKLEDQNGKTVDLYEY